MLQYFTMAESTLQCTSVVKNYNADFRSTVCAIVMLMRLLTVYGKVKKKFLNNISTD
ncbi:hypothetical protein JYU34_004921, partial [Plutella xylostella]